MTAEAHLHRCLQLLDQLSGMGADPAAIDVFYAMTHEVEAGIEAIDDDTDTDVARNLEKLAEDIMLIGSAGLAAGVVERARLGG